MKTISSKQFYELGLKKNEALRDVRVTSDYNIEHIDGAFNKPVEDFEKHKEEAKRYDTLYIYCNTSIDSQMFCKYAEKHNINAINIKNGIVERKQKYPTNRLKKTLPLMQQVHITAGALILL